MYPQISRNERRLFRWRPYFQEEGEVPLPEVLKSLKDSIKILKSRDTLMPKAKTLGTTQRCINSVASRAVRWIGIYNTGKRNADAGHSWFESAELDPLTIETCVVYLVFSIIFFFAFFFFSVYSLNVFRTIINGRKVWFLFKNVLPNFSNMIWKIDDGGGCFTVRIW